MCGIVGAAAERDVVAILVEGLKRLEYRGYDSAGIALQSNSGDLSRARAMGKVCELEANLRDAPLSGHLGIAHTRWATHGCPACHNAHPHTSRDTVAVVHNGIIENHEALRIRLQELGYAFTSDTDTEVIAHLVHYHREQHPNLCAAVRASIAELEGAYALGVISTTDPGQLVAARLGSPLVVGLGNGEHFVASDISALLSVTQQFIFLENGDVADVSKNSVVIYDRIGQIVERPVKESQLTVASVDRGDFQYYMQKEIYEQTRAIGDTLEGRLCGHKILEDIFGSGAAAVLDDTQGVQILACGTSYHAGLVARYWIESITGLPCSVEIASEFRYRKPVLCSGTLVVCISQSGETADTLAALQETKRLGHVHSLAICNVSESSLVRETELSLMTHAGPEIGVASTKAFTTQLVALLLLVIALGRRHGLTEAKEAKLVAELLALPALVEKTLGLDSVIRVLATRFAKKEHALFLGRGTQYPVAMEGALKLKEISYIHAEAYPAGELKHGPLALVEPSMPVIAMVPNDLLSEKVKSNLQEVHARGGQLCIFADVGSRVQEALPKAEVIEIPHVGEVTAPIVYTIPLQLLAYHVAVLRGIDVDHPRNLAKAVTVE
ncbi:L-glutamine--D-fructose-6-phosphate aminotransferase [Gammaproteobacteria bacterium]